MKVRLDKFLAKLLDESYDKDIHGFILKKLLERHHIPTKPTDQIYTFTDYVNGKFTGKPLYDRYPCRHLHEILSYWDHYIENPISGTIFYNWDTIYYIVKKKRMGFTHNKRGFKIPIIQKYYEPHHDISHVVDHINLFVKSNNIVKKYIIYLEEKKKKTLTLKPSNIETYYYNLIIKEDV